MTGIDNYSLQGQLIFILTWSLSPHS